MFQFTVLLAIVLVTSESECNVLLFAPKSAAAIICPDGGSCPERSTCCQMMSGKYGCCPLTLATCCSDRAHCCPQGYSCDVAHDKCVRPSGHAVSLSSIQPSSTTQLAVIKAAVHGDCPDGTKCDDDSTCCKIFTGVYGCCPFKQAVCCPDQTHCCLHGQTCNVEKKRCDGKSLSLPWNIMSLLRIATVPHEKCLDGSSCPDGNTCCRLDSGYGCCPYPNAVCCSDRLHCCPNGYKCNLKKQACEHDSASISWSARSSNKATVRDVDCPDKTSCPEDMTCCLAISGGYACCPSPQATCCSDKEHCCPHGYTCNLPQKSCDKDSLSVPWSATSMSRVAVDDDIVCPDGSRCDAHNTCCQLASGTYGCCPYPKATCCSDKEHCCPHGYKCNLEQKSCDKDSLSVPWSATSMSHVAVDDDIICPDGSRCDAHNTCCQLASGTYGCCPYPKATCCSDKEHCCPHGYTCNLAQQKCDKDSLSVPWSATSMSRVAVDDNICPDGSHCGGDNTCCPMGSDVYGCCPYPKATCCNDHAHCCPNGYQCDVASQTCKMQDIVIPWVKKLPATPAPSSSVSHMSQKAASCDCPSGHSCCKLANGEGCCQFENAVCCSDGLHCCPSGTTCVPSTRMCQSNTDSLAISWQPVLRKSAFMSQLPQVSKPNEECPDKTQCNAGSTCCEMQSSHYGCCPYEQATCCSDKLHCCPKDMKCNVEEGSCNKNGMQLPWDLFTRRLARQPMNTEHHP